MKKLNRTGFERIKRFLSLSTVGEVMMREHLGKDTVNWVDASETHQDYMDMYQLFLEKKEIENIESNRKIQQDVYVTPLNMEKLKEHIDARFDELKGLLR